MGWIDLYREQRLIEQFIGICVALKIVKREFIISSEKIEKKKMIKM